MCFPPNLTNLLQPCDFGLYRSMKANLSTTTLELKLFRVTYGLAKQRCPPFSEVFEKTFHPDFVIEAFRKCGIYPFARDIMSKDLIQSSPQTGDDNVGHEKTTPNKTQIVETRTTRTPAFWGYPTPPHNYPYYWIILDPKSREDKVKVKNLKNLPKFHIFLILTQTLHATHLLRLLDKMRKYEMDLTSIVEDTVQTRFCPQTDRRARWNQHTPLSTSLKPGV